MINKRIFLNISVVMICISLFVSCTNANKNISIKKLTEEQVRNSPDKEDLNEVSEEKNTVIKKVDDWQFTPTQIEDFSPASPGTVSQSHQGSSGPVMIAQSASKAVSSIGLSVGGAKDINNFREDIKNNFLPIPTDITYEGLFYDYLFDTGIKKEVSCDKLFCPSYTSAISKDPFSKKQDYFLSVGLNSDIKQNDFTRKKLNLVVVLDISGSMSSPFNRYYYDQFKTQAKPDREGEKEEDWNKTKMQVASESIVVMLKHLNSKDNFGVVLFDNTAYLAKPIRKVGDTDMEAIKKHIMELRPQGGTNMFAGMEMAQDLFKQFKNFNKDEVENRIIFLTDAQPNRGELSDEGILDIAKKSANQKIYTSFIGVGVDFNTELIELITKVKGANYHSVHSPGEFTKHMDKNFDYMVTPLVFNLQLKVEALAGFKIQKVYGSPEANEATGEIMKVNTLFPSERTEEGARGGLVLLHLKKVSGAGEGNMKLGLVVSYEDREGKTDSDFVTFEFEEKKEDYYANTGIRKGIVLARYASLMKNWILHERISIHPENFLKAPAQNEQEAQLFFMNVGSRYHETGIPIFLEKEFQLGRWERQSNTLAVSPEYKKLFSEFMLYFQSEQTVLEDKTMEKELTVLNILLNH